MTLADASTSSAGGIITILAILVVAFLVARWLLRDHQGTIAGAPLETQNERFMRLRTAVAQRAIVPLRVDDVIAKPSETFYLRVDSVTEVLEQHHARYRGGNAGVSVHVARGVTLRTGRYAGTRVDEVQTVAGDSGRFYVSDKRLLFIGSKHTVEVPLSHVVSATDFLDAFKIDRSNAASLLYQTTEPSVALVIRRIMAGQFEAINAMPATTN